MKQLTKSLAHILTISLLVLLIPTNPVSASTPTYIYEWMSQSGTISSDLLAHEYTNLEAGQTIDLSLTLINRSNTTIQGKQNLSSSPNLQVPIGSYGIGSQTPYQDGTPYFLDTSSFVLNNNRFAYYEGSDVLPNEAISMSWTIKLATNLSDGVYNLYVRPVSEYLAWTRQIKTGKLLPTTSSDIFWRLTVGEGEQKEYLTYTNDQYGFSFDYEKPISPQRLIIFDPDINTDYIFRSVVGVPDTGAGDSCVRIWHEKNLNNAIGRVESGVKLCATDGYSVENLSLNGLDWTVFKYHSEYADANHEQRIGQLSNGYVIGIESKGWFRSQPDQTFLNSVSNI